MVRTNIDCGCILLGTTMAEDGVEMTWVIDCSWLLTALGYSVSAHRVEVQYAVTGHVGSFCAIGRFNSK